MRAVGLITEYNPFHNGHLHHLRESLTQADAQVSVAVMSGHFLQRGEAALFDKWRRTELALAAGVDLVLELPFPWACNSAPHFAKGAIQALNGLGGVTALCFGSECGQLEPLRNCANLLREQSAVITEQTGELLRRGVSYPAARSQVVGTLADDPDVVEMLAQPNNILGIEYLRALEETGSSLRPLTIRRIGAGYHDQQVVEGIASATGIRQLLRQGESIDLLMPQGAAELLSEWMESNFSTDEEHLLRMVLARINQGVDSLVSLYQISDGLENRLQEMADMALSYEDLVSQVKSRQLTRTRIQRALCYLINDVKTGQMNRFLKNGPLYIHLLGCSSAGEKFLAYCRNKTTIPIVGNYSRIYVLLKKFYGADSRQYRIAHELLDLELKATRNYTLLMGNWQGGNRNRDFFEELRRVN